jgi:hypothetical protein
LDQELRDPSATNYYRPKKDIARRKLLKKSGITYRRQKGLYGNWFLGKDDGLAEVISSGSKQQRMVEVDEGVEGLRRRRGERS